MKVLADIELAQTLKTETEKAQEEMVETVPHPLDQDYNSLKCCLSLLDKKMESFKVKSHLVTFTSSASRGSAQFSFTLNDIFLFFILLCDVNTKSSHFYSSIHIVVVERSSKST